MAKTTPNRHGLTDQQLKFCQEYAKSLNATQAYKAAGYKWKNDAVARAASSKLLTIANIRAYLGEVLNLTEVSVVHETVAIALANISDVMEWDEEGVSVVSSGAMSNRGKSAIKSIKCKKKTVTRTFGDVQEVDVTTEWEVTLHDKLAAIEKLMKKLSLYPKQDLTTDADVLMKLGEMGVAPGWMLDSASRIFGQAVEDVSTILHGHLPEPSGYQSRNEREGSKGLSKETVNQIRAQIMGIEPYSPNEVN